ncbi:AMP-binding protein [Sphingopyxis sp. SE2]|uniref:AMP-binding protein n=1 Tax=Sphingopyxis sp. SE2 TaxID=1586240 RepID=UPI0028BF9723|nr:AMP-binding protein [Sphingopyxis sp. SE2]MDT7529107.1 AMP-binding protein [Sphingopyxis sp. SE2]
MNPQVVAQSAPDRAATIMAATGETMTYGELDSLARKVAGLLRRLGFGPGDHLAMMIDNEIMYHPVAWGAWYAGLYFTPVSTRLTASEVAYLVEDSGSRIVIASPAHEGLIAEIKPGLPQVAHWILTGTGAGGTSSLRTLIESEAELAVGPTDAVGADMLYSSGTTGRPKGIKPRGGAKRDEPNPLASLLTQLYGFDAATRYLTPAPLYHGSPTKYSMAVHRAGGTNIIMEGFDAEGALAAIDRFGVTHSQWVPTMLHRMVRLPDETKARYDLSSHRVAIHAAAPCPPELKQQMIDWWGPIVWEFYAGSEAVGYTSIDSAEALARPGSVGRSVFGDLHILDGDGKALPAREIGHIYFANGPAMEYHKDPAKTARAYNDRGWVTLGDMGWLDEEGYLYLADRKDFMIITGGVNVYPAEIEQLLVMHPEVDDAAVFGIPNEDFGQEVKAVIQPRLWPDDEAAFQDAIIAYCRAHLSRIKVPRSVDLSPELPRQPNGKLYKTALRAAYLKESQS